MCVLPAASPALDARVSRARARARVRLAASGGLQPLASSALRRSLADGFAVCKAMQNSNQARWKCHSCPAVQSLASPCFLVCYWTLVGKHAAQQHSLGPLAAQIGGAHAHSEACSAHSASAPRFLHPCGQRPPGIASLPGRRAAYAA